MSKQALIDCCKRRDAANELLAVIASYGRKFFAHDDNVAFLEVDYRGRVWFHDQYSGKRIYTHHGGRWRGFTGGGTLRSLVIELRGFIKFGTKVNRSTFGPWPNWYGGGDLWGYGDDMEFVRLAARRLGIIADHEEGGGDD